MTFVTHNPIHEMVISFDTTGSMSSCLNEVRGRINELIQRLQADIPGIRIAVFAHGDYCDASVYVTKHVDFTQSVLELCEFVSNVEETGGGDTAECYELVMREVRKLLSWSDGSRRSLVMVGDAYPHGANDSANKSKIDWKEEVVALRDAGIHTYGVQCGSDGESSSFFETLAQKTMGRHIKLSEFANLFHVLLAICYHEEDPRNMAIYERELREGNPDTNLHSDLEEMFGSFARSLDAPEVGSDTTASTDVTPVKNKALAFPERAARIRKRKINPPRVPSTLAAKIKKNTSRDRTTITSNISKRQRSRRLGIYSKLRKRTVKTVGFLDPTNASTLNTTEAHRECIPEEKFTYKDLDWSQWRRFALRRELHGWRKRETLGYINADVFPSYALPAIYEIAVRVKPTCKKNVVYGIVKRGSSSVKNIERFLFPQKASSVLLDRVVQFNYEVLIRRAQVKSFSETCKSFHKISYAWRSGRVVTARGVCI